ncbi:hypothetical protein QJS04_geneDACA005049 [Acorus gramineus]|uniref:Trichome birefringence-like C-terminal domain-containing protein n=1 Tax=Acorus gramineus TaxID=55184 RepID=A0AAV9AZU8_ACOGR|nr:hypothetical protein QJS04_geneDACA005049 [Acorus gramineus]
MNGSDFLERMRGKRMILVGDSMNRSMLQSLACILRQSLGNWSRVHEVRRKTEFKAVGYNSLFFEDYEFYLDFFQTPFLVERVYNGSIEVNLRLDVVDEGTSAIRKSDIVIFNTGHWFTDQKTYGGKNYYQEGNYVHPQLDHMEAYTRALKTWAKWIDHTFSHGKTKVFFQGSSPTHFRGGQWNSGGKCHMETEPIFNETFLEEYPVQNRIFEQVRGGMQTPVVYLNITRLTDYRKDGHVSMYYLERRTPKEKVMAVKLQDCSHWCMPGVPDTWNELLYASLVMDGQD